MSVDETYFLARILLLSLWCSTKHWMNAVNDTLTTPRSAESSSSVRRCAFLFAAAKYSISPRGTTYCHRCSSASPFHAITFHQQRTKGMLISYFSSLKHDRGWRDSRRRPIARGWRSRIKKKKQDLKTVTNTQKGRKWMSPKFARKCEAYLLARAVALPVATQRIHFVSRANTSVYSISNKKRNIKTVCIFYTPPKEGKQFWSKICFRGESWRDGRARRAIPWRGAVRGNHYPLLWPSTAPRRTNLPLRFSQAVSHTHPAHVELFKWEVFCLNWQQTIYSLGPGQLGRMMLLLDRIGTKSLQGWARSERAFPAFKRSFFDLRSLYPTSYTNCLTSCSISITIRIQPPLHTTPHRTKKRNESIDKLFTGKKLIQYFVHGFPGSGAKQNRTNRNGPNFVRFHQARGAVFFVTLLASF